VREGVVVPDARGQHQVHAQRRTRRLRGDERVDDRGVVQVRVLDEDRLARGADQLDVALPHLVRLIVRLVEQHLRFGDGPSPGLAVERLGRLVVRAAIEDPAVAEMRVDLVRDRPFEPRQAVVPLPPGLPQALLLALLAFHARVLPRIEGIVEQILRADVRAPAVRHPAVDDDDLAVVDVQVVDGDGVPDLRADRAQPGISHLHLAVVVDVGIHHLGAALAEEFAERVDVGRVVVDVRIVADHPLLAGGERIAHLRLLPVQQHAHLHAFAGFAAQRRGDLLPDGIAEEEKDGEVDGPARLRDVAQQRGQDAVAIDEKVGVNHVPDESRCSVVRRQRPGRRARLDGLLSAAAPTAKSRRGRCSPDRRAAMEQRQVYVVTGSSSGVGAATARALASRGAGVVINFSKQSAPAEDVAQACTAAGGDAVVVRGDVADDGDCRRLASAALQRWGRIDGLVNNAGTTKFAAMGDLDALSADDFQRIYAVNLVGAYQMVRACTPGLRAARGAVVNVSSIAGSMGIGSSHAYAASKGALNALTLALARALGPDIRVNAVP